MGSGAPGFCVRNSRRDETGSRLMPRGKPNNGATHCTICTHPARPQIDLAVCTGLSKRQVAERFRVSPHAVWRHGQHHLSPELKAALALKLIQREGDTRAVLLE